MTIGQSQTPTAGPDTPCGSDRFGLSEIQETRDPCHWERVSQPWEVLGTPRDARVLNNRKVFLATKDCILYREAFAGPLRVRALSPEGMLAVSVPLRLGSGTRFFNRAAEVHALPAMLPGAAEASWDTGHQR